MSIQRISPSLLILACAWLMSAIAAHAADTPPPIEVETVVLRPMHAAEVPAQQTGLLRELTVGEGEQVAEGQVLAVLDQREAELLVRQAKIECELATEKAGNQVQLRYAQKALEVARAELSRSEESVESFAKSISQSQLDVEKLTVEKLTLEIEQAEHDLQVEQFNRKLKQNELEAARLRLEQHKLRAPFAGTVALVRGRVGEWVEVGSPVLRLVAVEQLRAEGFLDSEVLDVAGNTSPSLVGSKVQLIVSRPGGAEVQLPGVLRYVSPEMDPVNRQVRVWAEVDNSQRQLRPGDRGRLLILQR